MVGNILFLVGLFLSSALVWRALASSWWKAYPVVFCYFAITLAHSVSGWLVYALLPGSYAKFRWVMEALYIVLGFGLIWQVYAAIPQRYPGVGRIIKLVAKNVSIGVPIFLIFFLAIAPPETFTLDVLETNFRVLQALLILVIFGLAMYYGIPLSRNLEALTRGYGLYIAIFIARFLLWPLQYAGIWQFVMPLAYFAAQLIWLRGLWTYENPTAEVLQLSDNARTTTETEITRLRRQLQTSFFRE